MEEWLEKTLALAKDNYWTVLGVVLGTIFSGIGVRLFFRDKGKAVTTTTDKSVAQFGHGSIVQADRDNIIQTIMQGIDERDLRLWLGKLTAKKLEGRERQVGQWYEQKQIPANLREALLLIVKRIDSEIEAAKSEVDKLHQSGEEYLAIALEKLNDAFDDGLDQFEQQKRALLAEISGAKGRAITNKVTIYRHLANKYKSLFLYDKAVEAQKFALQLIQDNGWKNTEVADIITSLGSLYHLTAKYDLAIEHYERALSIYNTMLGPDSDSAANIYINLGEVWRTKGEYERSIKLQEVAKEILIKRLGSGHLTVAICFNNLGEAWRSKGNIDKAIYFHEKARVIFENEVGLKHSYTASCYNNLGAVWDSKGDYAKALDYFLRANSIDVEVLGTNHPTTAISYNNIGAVLYSKGDYNNAILNYQKAMEILEGVFGVEHPLVGTFYVNMGEAVRATGDHMAAIVNFEKALEVRLKTLGPRDPALAPVYNSLGLSWYAVGEQGRALGCFHNALVILEAHLGSGHEDIITVKRNISLLEKKPPPLAITGRYGKSNSSEPKPCDASKCTVMVLA